MKKKGFIECLTDFMSDSEGLTQEEIASELEELGIDTAKLAASADEIAKRGSAARPYRINGPQGSPRVTTCFRTEQSGQPRTAE